MVGALAMESLHRQVLPFLLRRMKEDVLQDLPPKIIQDYYCELTPLQVSSFTHNSDYLSVILMSFVLEFWNEDLFWNGDLLWSLGMKTCGVFE